MNENLNVSFEYTVDEAVAFQTDHLKATKEGASWRRREQLTFAISFIVIIALWAWVSSDRSPESILGLIVLALVVGPIATVLFGRYYDHLITSRLRRLMIEQLGGPGPHPCAIEIRPDGLWVAQPGVQLTFPWRDATKVEDVAEGIIVTFVGGRVLARTRGFRSPEHRSDFVARVRDEASATAPAGTAT